MRESDAMVHTDHFGRTRRDVRTPSVGVDDRVGRVRQAGLPAVAEKSDGGDADDRDQGNEEGVLDQRGATLVIETGPKPVGEELERGDHFLLAPYGNGGGGGDDHPRIPGCWLPVPRTIGGPGSD